MLDFSMSATFPWGPMNVCRRWCSLGCRWWVIAVIMLSMVVGCTYKPGYIQGKRTDVPNRWQVEKVELARLSDDQRAVLDRRGPPMYVRFFREV